MSVEEIKCPVNAAYPQFLDCETLSEPFPFVVPDSCAPDYGPEGTHGPGSDLHGFLLTGSPPALFPGRLVEPCSYPSLPVFVEMGIWNHIIPFRRHCG